jgi:aryl-alcohol dehydrogenase-like predicted oxidoreductase
MVIRIERSPLDRTRLLVSSLGMGYARLGAIWQERSDKDVREGLALALIAGKNVFDPTGTVERSERVLGSAFQGIRDEFIVATKCGLIGTPSTFLNTSSSVWSRSDARMSRSPLNLGGALPLDFGTLLPASTLSALAIKVGMRIGISR